MNVPLHLNISCYEDVLTIGCYSLLPTVRPLWFGRENYVREGSYLSSDPAADMGGNKLRHAPRHRAPLLASSVSVTSRTSESLFHHLASFKALFAASLHHSQPLPVYRQVFMPNLR